MRAETEVIPPPVLVVLDFPLPPAEAVRLAVQEYAGNVFCVLGEGIPETYLRSCGLGNARIITLGASVASRLSLLRSLRRVGLAAAIFVGCRANLLGRLMIVFVRPRRSLFQDTIRTGDSLRKVGFMSLLPLLAWKGVLFLLSLPLMLIPRLFLRGGIVRPAALPGPRRPVPWTGSHSPPVSLVVPNYNGRELLEDCLPSLEAAAGSYPGGAEIVVVDDASRDGSVAWIEKHYPRVRIIALSENRGFACASNLGVSSARHRLVVLLNSDIVVEKDFLAPLIPHFFTWPDVFAVQPKMLEINGKDINRGLNMGHMERGYIRIWNEREMSPQKYVDFPAGNLYAIGGAMAFDREIWNRLDGFDGLYYPFCWEDIDISYRAAKRGYAVVYEPESRVRHVHHGTISRFFKADYKRSIEHKNEMLFIWKNIHSPALIREHFKMLPLLFLLGLLRGDRPFCLGFLKACFSLPRAGRKRRGEIALSRFTDEEVFQRSLLPYQNWVKRGFRNRAPAEKPHLLMINTVVPYPPRDGGKIRVYQMLKHLSSRYHVHFLAFALKPEEQNNLSGLREYCFEAEALPFSPLPLNPFERALMPRYYQGWASQEMLGKIREILARHPIEVVHIDFTLMAYYRNVLDDVPSVFTEHDAGVLRLGESYNPSHRGWKKALEFYDWLRSMKFELDQCPRFNRVVTLSAQDEALLKSFLPDLRTRVVVTGTDVEHFYRPYQEVNEPRLVFIGALAHYPNVDALRWFVREVFPRIRQGEPRTILAVVGSGDPSRVEDVRRQAGVEFVGEVADVRPQLERAAVFVAPIRLGSGIKGKVLDALAMGKAVVATEAASRGLPFKSGEHLLIADRAEEFARAVLRLLADPQLRKRLAIRGQAVVVEGFSWKQTAEKLDAVFREVLVS